MIEQGKVWKKYLCSEKIKLSLFLKEILPINLSSREIKTLLEAGCCRINGKIERFASTVLKKGDEVCFAREYKHLLKSQKRSEKLSILYEDKYFLIINKSPYLASTPIDLKKIIKQPFFLVHRLDKQTSGVLILAKTEKAKEKMMQLFAKREILKFYLALVDGRVTKKEGKLQSFLTKKKAFQGQSIWGSSKKGKLATTYWKVLFQKKNISALVCKPITGRTHQLRVQLSEMGHPIIGDYQYSKTFAYLGKVSRMMLHCFAISFLHPFTGQKIEIKAPIPNEFSKIFERLFRDFFKLSSLRFFD